MERCDEEFAKKVTVDLADDGLAVDKDVMSTTVHGLLEC